MSKQRHILDAKVTDLSSWELSKDGATATIERILRTHKRGYRSGSVVELEGAESGINYCLLSGWLSLAKLLEDGQRQIIDFALPGDFLNIASADQQINTVQIEAVTYATVAAIPEDRWTNLLDDLPQLRRLEGRVIAGALSRLSERMLRLGKGSAEARIAHAMIELCVRLRAIGEVRDCTFHLPLTQQQLGDFVGLSSVHVCRTMRRLTRQDIIKMEGHMDITIRNMDALATIAGVDPAVLEKEIIPRP